MSPLKLGQGRSKFRRKSSALVEVRAQRSDFVLQGNVPVAIIIRLACTAATQLPLYVASPPFGMSSLPPPIGVRPLAREVLDEANAEIGEASWHTVVLPQLPREQPRHRKWMCLYSVASGILARHLPLITIFGDAVFDHITIGVSHSRYVTST